MPRFLRRLSPTALLGCFLAFLLLAGGLFIVFERHTGERKNIKTDSESLIVRRISVDDPIIGELSAPVQVIVYSSLSCPYCKSFFEESLPSLSSAYGDRIVVAYRHLPLVFQPNSRLEANAAECVHSLGGNDAFWKFVRTVFAQPAQAKGLSLSALTDIAERVGVSEAQLSSCVQSGENDARIQADMLEASVAGISQTPGIVLKSATRALVVQGDYYSQIDTGIQYLLQSNN